MDRKKGLSALTLLLLTTACATQSARRNSPTSKEGVAIYSPLPPALSKSPTEPLQEVTSPSGTDSNRIEGSATVVRKKNFGIWIDGVGLESVAALGFLQELEKAGYKAKKVVGVGFGCWVALSWALQNNGNQAEWQAFKWTDWKTLGGSRGLLGRLTSTGGKSQFETEVRRLLPAKDLAGFKLPVDCPLFEKKAPYRFFSGRSTDLVNMLWSQFQLPALGLDPDAADSDFYSGALGTGPLPRELDDLARDIPGEPGADFAGWIVLRTRGLQDRSSRESWVNLLSSRADQLLPSAGLTPLAATYVVLDLSDGMNRAADQTKNFENRRRWLLEGRRRAGIVLKGDEFKKFLQGNVAN